MARFEVDVAGENLVDEDREKQIHLEGNEQKIIHVRLLLAQIGRRRASGRARALPCAVGIHSLDCHFCSMMPSLRFDLSEHVSNDAIESTFGEAIRHPTESALEPRILVRQMDKVRTEKGKYDQHQVRHQEEDKYRAEIER